MNEALVAAMMALWTLLLGSAALKAGRALWSRTVPLRDGVILALCVLVGLGLRLSVEDFPGDIRLTLPQQGDRAYWWGAGMSASLRMLFTVFPASFDTIVMANVLLGAVTVLPVYAFVSSFWESRPAALAAACLIATTPHLVRFSATDSAHIPLAFALFMGMAYASAWGRRGGLALVMHGAGWFALCANLRMDAVTYVPIAVVVAFAVKGRLPRRRIAELAAGAGVAALLTVQPALALWQASQRLGGLRTVSCPWAIRHNPVFEGPYYPTGLAVLCLVGVVATLFRRRTCLRALAALAALGIVSLSTFFCAWRPGSDFLLRHALPLCALWVSHAGVGVSAIAEVLAKCFPRLPLFTEPGALRPLGTSQRTFALLGVAAVALLAASAMAATSSLLSREWTHQLEWRFLRDHIAQVDDGCIIVFEPDEGDDDRGLLLTPHVSAGVSRDHQWRGVESVLADPPDADCVVFLLQARCHAKDMLTWDEPWTMHPLCAEIFARFEAQPLAETRIPARPYVGERYTVDPVPVGLYRLWRNDTPGAGPVGATGGP